MNMMRMKLRHYCTFATLSLLALLLIIPRVLAAQCVQQASLRKPDITEIISSGWPTAPDGPYTWGYCFKIQRGNPDSHCKPSVEWPCAPGKKYYGRGPIQISYNYNYGPCGDAIGENLLRNPDLVAADRVISFKTALWVWMTSTSKPPMPTCHDDILGKWKPSTSDTAANRLPGYGVITNILNGGLECGHGFDEKVKDRIGFYLRYCKILGVSPGENLDCGNQKPFGHFNSIYVE
uniref:Basic 30 kDa endochitinase-like n=1 Tax=Nicotiana tabacum TaxID=4097 RepID=A0A1S3X9H8_TOBAC|nr:PREDICTED: basic 30 kDa endochitinase-like [Nicotiana tabacum]